jgi:hypothetical protein
MQTRLKSLQVVTKITDKIVVQITMYIILHLVNYFSVETAKQRARLRLSGNLIIHLYMYMGHGSMTCLYPRCVVKLFT